MKSNGIFKQKRALNVKSYSFEKLLDWLNVFKKKV